MISKKKLGLIIIALAVLIGVLSRSFSIIPNLVGKIICGNNYMQPVDGVVGDVSCGFNTDMHLIALSIAGLITGIILVLLSKGVTK
ncbi:MAG: hypothetical protein L3J51_00805 [Cocleimonas sp.]|nr:hypothetical protein [Cocleimonas sp.]